MPKTNRTIGPRMQAVADYVSTHPGSVSWHVAQAVGPNGSTRFGYEAINRAVAAGIVVRKSGKGNTTHLYPAS